MFTQFAITVMGSPPGICSGHCCCNQIPSGCQELIGVHADVLCVGAARSAQITLVLPVEKDPGGPNSMFNSPSRACSWWAGAWCDGYASAFKWSLVQLDGRATFERDESPGNLGRGCSVDDLRNIRDPSWIFHAAVANFMRMHRYLACSAALMKRVPN